MHFIRTNFLKDPLARTIGQKLRDIIKKVSVCLEFRMELISTILVSMVIDLLTILWINSQFFFLNDYSDCQWYKVNLLMQSHDWKNYSESSFTNSGY